MPLDWTLILLIAGGLAVMLPLARAFRRHFTVETNRLIFWVAITGLIGQSAIVLTTSVLIRPAVGRIELQIQDIQARTVLFEHRVKEQKAAYQTLGARPADIGSGAGKIWLERRMELDRTMQITRANVDQLVKDAAALKKSQAELVNSREKGETKMLGGLALILVTLLLYGVYRNSARARRV
jgi:hypothetical protein